MKKTILIISGVCLSSSAYAGGYRVALQGQQALGMGHTGVAMTQSAEVVFFNPAGMAFLEKDTNIVGGITLISSDTKYQNSDTNTAAETDNPIGTPVGLYYTKKHNEKISYGIGLYTPYGNTVEWQKDWAGSYLVNDIEFKAIYIQPTISYKINDQYSVGLGMSYISGDVTFNRNLSTSLVDENGARSNVTISDSGISAFNFNIGFLVKPTDELNVGFSYRSKADMKSRGGDANFENVPSSLQSSFPDTTFNADLVLPAELTLGVAFDLDDKTILTFDFNRTFWSEYKTLDIDFASATPTSVNPRNYQDSNIYRFGAQHDLNEKFVVRGGIYFDKSPIPAGYFVPETPRNDSIGLTAGASYMLSERMDLDFSFLYLMFDEFNGSYDFFNQSGTLVSFGGDYKSTVVTLGFGLNYKF